MGLIGLHVSDNLLFHLEECETPKENWEKLAFVFGGVNEFHTLELETKLSALVPDAYAFIEEYLAQFRSLLSQLKACGKEKKDGECIFLILSKLKGHFQVFASTFYASRDALGDKFQMPSFEIFCDRLIQEQTKLKQLDVLSSSSNQALVAHNSKDKHKARFQPKKNYAQACESPSKTKQNNKSSPPVSKNEESSSNTNKKRKEADENR